MRGLLPIVALLLASPAQAEETFVDIELVLAVDVSRSMSPRELEIQRRGYAEALSSGEVVDAITGGIHGQIALTYIEWAGYGQQRTIIGWTLVGSQADADAIAQRLTARFEPGLRRTSISSVIAHASDSFEGNGYRGLRRVIDISGDGPNNMGRRVDLARDAATARGIVINGLPLMTREGLGMQWHLDDLDQYYRDCVIGGPGAFVIPVLEWRHFPAAVRRKLVLEIAGQPARVLPAQFTRQPGAQYDCLIGEKIWDEIMRDWE